MVENIICNYKMHNMDMDNLSGLVQPYDSHAWHLANRESLCMMLVAAIVLGKLSVNKWGIAARVTCCPANFMSDSLSSS